jgi:hypothetical protein
MNLAPARARPSKQDIRRGFKAVYRHALHEYDWLLDFVNLEPAEDQKGLRRDLADLPLRRVLRSRPVRFESPVSSSWRPGSDVSELIGVIRHVFLVPGIESWWRSGRAIILAGETIHSGFPGADLAPELLERLRAGARRALERCVAGGLWKVTRNDLIVVKRRLVEGRVDVIERWPLEGLPPTEADGRMVPDVSGHDVQDHVFLALARLASLLRCGEGSARDSGGGLPYWPLARCGARKCRRLYWRSHPLSLACSEKCRKNVSYVLARDRRGGAGLDRPPQK